MDAKECREAFEAWAKEQKQGFMLSHVIDGVYLDDPTHCAWLAWQAAWNRRARLAEPEGEPVAWQWFDTGQFRKELPVNAVKGDWHPVYRTPPTAAAVREQAIEECARVAEERSQFAPRNEQDIVAVQHGGSIAAAIRNLDKTRH